MHCGKKSRTGPGSCRGRPRRRTRRVLALSLVAMTAADGTSAALAQSGAPGPDSEWVSTGLSEAAFLSVNALLGGLTAGVLQKLRGGSFSDGFAQGTLGGAVVYGGKRLAVESFAGAGFLGREVAAVGSSVVRNASEGRPSLEEVVLPVGPVRLYVRPTRGWSPRAKLDVLDAYWTAYGLAESRLELDASESLSAGAPVFRARDAGLRSGGRPVLGLAAGGVVFLASAAGPHVVTHEVVHVIQHDFAHRAWTGPVDHWLAGRLPWDGFRERLEFDLVLPGLRHGLAWLWDFGVSSPWESEARFLGDKRRVRPTPPVRPPPPGPSIGPGSVADRAVPR